MQRHWGLSTEPLLTLGAGMQVRGGRASPAQLQQLPRGSLRGREMGFAVGRFVASSVKDLAPHRELGTEVPESTTGGKSTAAPGPGLLRARSTASSASCSPANCAKTLPRNSPAQRALLSPLFLGLAWPGAHQLLPAEPVECPAEEQPLELPRCHPQDGMHRVCALRRW